MPNASPEAKSELALTSEAAQKTLQGEIKHFKRLPTDPLNTSQKLAISFFLRVLICLKNNKSQAVFVLSGLSFRMWA